jgi:predicted nucleotidyltransferase
MRHDPPRESLMTREPVLLEPITPTLLDEVRDAIVAAIAPDRIILFGSVMRQGSAAPHDIDLYVIKSGLKDRREAERRIEQLFQGRLFALDVLISTPEQVEMSLQGGNSFLAQEVLGKGRVLYERDKQPA